MELLFFDPLPLSGWSRVGGAEGRSEGALEPRMRDTQVNAEK